MGVSSAPTTHRDLDRRAAVTRRLEDAALELFATRGFAATTVDDLAAAGGVGRRTFFRYFPTKLDVVLGELDSRLEALARALETCGEDPDALACARRAFLAVNRYAEHEVPSLRRRLTLLEEVPELAAHAAQRYRAWEMVLAADAARRWRIEPGALAAQVLARIEVAAMQGVFAVWLARADAGAGELATLVGDAFDAVARGFTHPAPGPGY